MIISAEMGGNAGEMSIITKTALRQCLIVAAGFVVMIVLMKMPLFPFRIELYWIAYGFFLILLLLTRAFGAANGAYAWIRLPGNFTIQPSEFAKAYIILFGAKMLGKDRKEDNIKYLKQFLIAAAVYFVIILIYQKDLGSAVVLFGITFIIVMIPPYKEFTDFHMWMLIVLAGGLLAIGLMLSPPVTNFLMKHSGNYMIGRFLAAANPFMFQYDIGYHLIIGLVSFATGGWFGLGYGQSIHKYMNFPNPSNDFILPVIVEEMGVVLGLMPILVLYGIIFYRLIKHSLKTTKTTCKMICVGTVAYLAIHFVLNVGGVSGLVPLTGVPLLLISSGGSSLWAVMMAFGLCENEIINYTKELEACE